MPDPSLTEKTADRKSPRKRRAGLLLTGALLLFLAFFALSNSKEPQPAFMPEHDFLNGSVRFPNGQFQNPIPTEMAGFSDMPKIFWRMYKRPEEAGKPAKAIPVRFTEASRFAQKPTNKLTVQWLGHATTVLELSGRRYLLDPVLSERVSMVSWAGPKRLHPAPVKASEISNIDAVIISHDHYDHLDKETIIALKDSVALFIVPLGVKEIIQDWGVAESKIRELDWGQQVTDGANTIVSTPARHFSGRWLRRNRTLWSSYAFLGQNERVFFGGDTGEMPLFSKIGEKYGPFDLTIIPIGAYDPAWQPIHTNAPEALEVHRQVKGRKMLPVHWATFDLALHRWEEPIVQLWQLAAEQHIGLLTPVAGELIDPDTYQSTPWWEPILHKK